ncbi:hypothetical protein ABZW11_41735 [Nonomuraea sp. NPDC004580]|uniref:hypothetical protein n=1 Tax=Nonomuraea sp. NPDC004580 TaxID=3154552 RepID=UPI0033BACE61
MPSFKRLTIEEARSLTRTELLPRIEAEQKYWYHRIHRCEMKPGDDAAFRTFNDILHIAVGDGVPADDTRHWTTPLGELGDL